MQIQVAPWHKASFVNRLRDAGLNLLHIKEPMSWKRKLRCKTCGYEAEVYEGRGLFRQQITAISCAHCHTIQNLVVGGIIADVAPSFRSEVGRLCLQCGSDDIRIWDMKTCPKWHLLEVLKVPSTYRGMCIVYKYDDDFHDDFIVTDKLQIEYYD